MASRGEQGLARWEIATAKKVVAECRRAHRILEHEPFEDLLQECLVHWLGVRSRVPEATGSAPPAAYMATVIRNRITDLIRELTSDKRGPWLAAVSLDTPIWSDEDSVSLGDMLEDERESDRTAASRVRLDLERVIAQLTPAQRDLCRLLGEEGLSIREASERLQIPRSTVYAEIQRIRRVFEDHGLGNFFCD
ncbi:MAG: sigma-70 family RNA polymerase sigma factor [Rhodocyclaceae bacterium]|nr:sigma-70 family RNA polymerase sigma factor [Rhodocyclaceae bacterium]